MPPTEFSPQELQDRLRSRRLNLGNILIDLRMPEWFQNISTYSLKLSFHRSKGGRPISVHRRRRRHCNYYLKNLRLVRCSFRIAIKLLDIQKS